VTAIKEIQTQAEGESSLKLRALHPDRGDEFTTREFDEVQPYKLQQNGVIQCWNGMVVATTRSMLKANGLPRWF
jgi:hypothetical protein